MSNVFTGTYNLHDIKYDLLKIIEPYDGLMYNRKDTEVVHKLFQEYLTDLKDSWQIREFSIYNTAKDAAVTFDVSVRLQRGRSNKKLKIHVGKLVHFRDR